MATTRRGTHRGISLSLQGKVLLLVLVPLLLTTMTLIGVVAYDLVQASRTALAEQRDLHFSATQAAILHDPGL